MNKRQQKRFAESLVTMLAKGDIAGLAGLGNELHAAAALWKPEDKTVNAIIDALTAAWLECVERERRRAKATGAAA